MRMWINFIDFINYTMSYCYILLCEYSSCVDKADIKGKLSLEIRITEQHLSLDIILTLRFSVHSLNNLYVSLYFILIMYIVYIVLFEILRLLMCCLLHLMRLYFYVWLIRIHYLPWILRFDEFLKYSFIASCSWNVLIILFISVM